MEYGILVHDVAPLPPDPRVVCAASWLDILPPGPLRAIYFGSEFCEFLLPDAVQVARYCKHAQNAGIEAVLLTPVATPGGLVRIKQLLYDLTAAGNAPAVVFNDWGVATLLREFFPALQRRAGRLINRGIRDPRLMEKEPFSGNTGERGKRLRSMLVSFGVSALETDPDLEGGFLGGGGEGMQRVLYLPYAFAASSRNCLIKADSAQRIDACFTKGLGTTCSGICRGESHRINRPDTHLPLWRAGNTVFFEVPQARVENHIGQADRIVLHERPTP
ncbi:MAG: hypothetical protein PHF56_20590 [Desulfuromonadaceae bacterium]|nr:hypothetical protein [Desulfuromonadaceae bacterium]